MLRGKTRYLECLFWTVCVGVCFAYFGLFSRYLVGGRLLGETMLTHKARDSTHHVYGLEAPAAHSYGLDCLHSAGHLCRFIGGRWGGKPLHKNVRMVLWIYR